MCISTVINLSLIVFFDTDYKRTNADKAAPVSQSLPEHPDYAAIQSHQSGGSTIVQGLESPGDSYINEDSSYRNGDSTHRNGDSTHRNGGDVMR